MSFDIPEHLMVEGIRAVEPHAVANRSQLLVPKDFDKQQFAAKWAFVGASAEAAQLPQRFVEGYTVDGWSVYKDEDKKPCIRPLGGKQVILLFRPKNLQAAVNAIYGNVSKQRTIEEQQGRTVQGQAVPQGLLADKQLRGYDPGAEAEDPIGYQFNKIPSVGRATMGARGTATRKKAK